jgi:hypothetical protein
MRTVYGDHDRFEMTYFASFKGYYATGDGARRDEHGYYWITGRIDDVINVSGHRIGLHLKSIMGGFFIIINQHFFVRVQGQQSSRRRWQSTQMWLNRLWLVCRTPSRARAFTPMSSPSLTRSGAMPRQPH